MVDMEVEQEDKRPSSRAFVWLSLLGLGVGLIAFVTYTVLNPKPLETLAIEGANLLSTQEILAFLAVDPGSLVKVESQWKTWEEKLLRHPRIKKAQVTRSREGVLLVQIEEKRAEFLLHIGRNLFEVDSEFSILSENRVREPGLFVITGKFPLLDGKVTGTLLSDITRELRSAFQNYPELKSRLSELEIQDDGEFLLYSKSPFRSKIYLGDTLHLLQIRKLYASLAYLESQGQTASEIDLRGEDAVYH